MEKERIVEMSCPECEAGTARRERTLFKRRIGKERAVHLNGKITKSKDHLSVNIQNIEKHLKLRNGEEVELYVNNDEIVIMSKGV